MHKVLTESFVPTDGKLTLRLGALLNHLDPSYWELVRNLTDDLVLAKVLKISPFSSLIDPDSSTLTIVAWEVGHGIVVEINGGVALAIFRTDPMTFSLFKTRLS